MNCPNCNTPLAMSERHGIEIDYCPNCRGIWLDRGELDKIIEKTSAPAFEQRPPIPPFSNHHSPHEFNRYQRKKNWLNDLFD